MNIHVPQPFCCISLIVEKFFIVFQLLEKNSKVEAGFKNSHKTMRLIWSWANFLKHPKAFVLVHHPIFQLSADFEKIETDEDVDHEFVYEVIDDEFVTEFYQGNRKKIPDLYSRLKNNCEVVVIFPDFLEINKGLAKEIEEVQNKILEDEQILIYLKEVATIENYWEIDNEIGD